MKLQAFLFTVLPIVAFAAPPTLNIDQLDKSLNRVITLETEKQELVAVIPLLKSLVAAATKLTDIVDGPFYHTATNEEVWQRYERIYAKRRADAETASTEYSKGTKRLDEITNNELPKEYLVLRGSGVCEASTKALVLNMLDSLQAEYEIAVKAGVRSANNSVAGIKSVRVNLEKICAL